MVNSRHNYHIPNSGCQIGVQWHPELLPKDDENSQIIFGELIEHAKQYHKNKL